MAVNKYRVTLEYYDGNNGNYLFTQKVTSDTDQITVNLQAYTEGQNKVLKWKRQDTGASLEWIEVFAGAQVVEDSDPGAIYYITALDWEKLYGLSLIFDAIVEEEILEIKEKYATPRKSEIAINYDDIDVEDLIPKEDVVVSLTRQGYVKRIPVSEYRAQKRGGVGLVAHKTKEEDFVKDMFVCSTHDSLMFFTNKGKVYALKAYEIPEAQRTAKGRAMVNLLELDVDEKVTTIITKTKDAEGNLVMATKCGLIKKTNIREFDSIRRNGKIAITLKEEDELVGVVLVQDADNILMGASSGKCINFNEANIRPSGRTSQGVKSMSLASDEVVVAITILNPEKQVLTISENGYGKRSLTSEYREQGRGGKGSKAGNFNEKTGKLVCLEMVDESQDIIAITDAGVIIRTPASAVNIIGRATSGVKLMKVADKAKIVSVAIVAHEEEVEEENIVENNEHVQDTSQEGNIESNIENEIQTENYDELN